MGAVTASGWDERRRKHAAADSLCSAGRTPTVGKFSSIPNGFEENNVCRNGPHAAVPSTCNFSRYV